MKIHNGLLVTGIATVGALGLLVCVSALRSHWNDTAAWVQAIGALSIIAVTAIIANRQSQAAEEKDRLAVRQLHESVAAIARACYGSFNKLTKATETQVSSSAVFYPSEFESIRFALAAVPLHQLGNQVLIENVLKVLGQTTYISAVLSAAPDFKIAFTTEGLKNQDTELFNSTVGIWRAVHGPAREHEFRF